MTRQALVLLLALGAAGTIAPPAHGAVSMLTAGATICSQTPTGAALGVATDPLVPNDLTGNNNCETLCQKWVTFCKGAVAASKGCWFKAIDKYAALRRAECETAGTPTAVKACEDSVSADKQSFTATLVHNVESAIDYCAAGGLIACHTHCD